MRPRSSPRPVSAGAFPRVLLLCAFILPMVSSAQAGAEVSSLTATPSIYLRGMTDGPSVLVLDASTPTTATPKSRDSAAVAFGGGNAWKEVGTWTAAPAPLTGTVVGLNDLHLFVGLKNSDDTGTRFDLRVEVYKDGSPLTTGQARCVTGITRNPDSASEIILPLEAFPPQTFSADNTLSLRILTRVGTTGTAAFCGGHPAAAGLRLYFDGLFQASRFAAPISAGIDWNTGVGGNPSRTGLSQAAGPAFPSVAWRLDGSNGPIFAGNPVAEGNLVVFSGAFSGQIAAHDLNTGAQRWTAQLPANSRDSSTSRVSAIRGGQVYAIGPGSSNLASLYSLNAADGSILWRSQDLIDEYGFDTLAFAANDDPIVGNLRSLTRINHVNGKTVWKTPRSCPFSGSCGAAVLGAHVYVADRTSSDGVITVLDVTTGKRLYSSIELGGYVGQSGLLVGPDATIYASLAIVPDSSVFAALRDTGSALVERWRRPMAHTAFSTFGVGPDGSVYTYSSDFQVLRLDPATGVSRNTSMPIPFDASGFAARLAIDATGRIFLTNNGVDAGAVFCFGPDLTFLWSDSVPGAALSSPALARDGTLVVGGYSVRAYRSAP